MEWRLADAKSRFSELVRRALAEGPQRVRRRNDAVVVLSERDYEKLAGGRPGLKQLLLHGPELDGLDLKRDPAPMRDVAKEQVRLRHAGESLPHPWLAPGPAGFRRTQVSMRTFTVSPFGDGCPAE